MAKNIGVLTAGGDSPGLNAAIRGLGKAAISRGMHLTGFKDGFRGFMENRAVSLDSNSLANILTVGGTLLGTSRDKPHRMLVGGRTLDMTDALKESFARHHLDVLVCLGGGGTQKSAYRLSQRGMPILTLPKTIDNDVVRTDVSFGFSTALNIATEAIDRLHSTAHSHHRIIVVEIMGHRAGWLALGSGIAGGADVILIPEIPYDIEPVADAIRYRSARGKSFSIVAVAEGAMPVELARQIQAVRDKRAAADEKATRKALDEETRRLSSRNKGNTLRLAEQLEELTGLQSRVTILGHVQRGGTPSAADRILATRIGTAAAEAIEQGHHGVMVAARGQGTELVPLEEVAGRRKEVPLDHPWVQAARDVGVTLGSPRS